MIYVYDSISS
ncbi:uncharacterized protein FTOL_11601 [Fusarium torulosum]|uniref:Uncharacterized protein n=1 Tax=Fusarium torulosum TaxID=33205 RepID=A0AAE8MIE4_9HYPO|nr:uncharacterized protein FTOL_11601 [Fusarium torulosum]